MGTVRETLSIVYRKPTVQKISGHAAVVQKKDTSHIATGPLPRRGPKHSSPQLSFHSDHCLDLCMYCTVWYLPLLHFERHTHVIQLPEHLTYLSDCN